MELDGGFAAQCAAALGSGGNSWPSFGLVLALFPEGHWDALSSLAPLRHWRLIETIGNGPLVASRLQIDGAQSPLDVDGSGNFNSPTIAIT
jgi:hypothetical protein